MSARAAVNRAVKLEEIAVIESAIERASVSPRVLTAHPNFAALRVVAVCGCGCESVDFVLHDRSHRSTILAEGIGSTSAGGTVGVIVWGTPDTITGLEIYDLGAGEDDLRLPAPDTIRPFVSGKA